MIDMDNFKFITNIKNPCGGGPTLDEYVEKLLNKKAAGVAAPEKEDSKEPDTEKGQVINSEGEEGVTNDPKMPGEKTSDEKTEVKEAAGKAKAEDAEGEGIPISLDASEEFQKGESTDGSKVTPDNKKTEAKGNSTETKKSESVEAEDKEEAKEDKTEEKEATASNWVKISNLNPKEKKMLKSFWLTQYPREYVDAMIQDR